MKALVGQKALVIQLNTIIASGRLGHAYIFSGPEGIGKRTFALSFVKEILCLGSEKESCRCISCRTLEQGTNPDFYEVLTDKASIGVDNIRDMQENVADRPTYGNRKVYFIDHAELMTVQAQNCLLKTLEEPPEYVVILLSSTSFDALLPTIQSRVVNFRMNPYSEEEMKRILSPIYNTNDKELEFILAFSRGIPGNAVHIIEQGMIKEIRSQVMKFLEKPQDFNQSENLRKLISDNREELSTVLDILMSVYRDCVMLRQGMENRLINDDKKDIIKRIALSSSQRKLLDKISALEKMRRNFKYNLNFQLVLEVLFLEIQEV